MHFSRISQSIFIFALLASAASGSSYPNQHLNIQPVTMCENSDGLGNRPSTCQDPQYDHQYLNALFGQLNITVNVKPLITISDFDLFRGSFVDAATPSDLTADINPERALSTFTSSIRSRGVAPHTAYVGFTGELLDNVLGLAFLPLVYTNGEQIPFPFSIVQNSVAIELLAGEFDPFPSDGLDLEGDGRLWVEDPPGSGRFVSPPDPVTGTFEVRQLTTPAESLAMNRRLVALTIAHEVSHNLGGTHESSDFRSVMYPTISSGTVATLAPFSVANADIITSSKLLSRLPAPVPAPSAMLALGTALSMLVFVGAPSTRRHSWERRGGQSGSRRARNAALGIARTRP